MPQPQHAPGSFLDELKRRKVVRVAIVYAAVAWAVVVGNADAFFAELEPYGGAPGDIHARYLADHPILSRFADDPRHAELVRALRMPVVIDG